MVQNRKLQVCVEQDENGNLKKDYVHGGQYIDQVIMESDSSTSLGSYYLTDLRYSVYAVVDSDGAVTERYRYDAYGKRDVMTPGFVVINTDAETEFGYTGRRHDSEDSGLMYFRARYYSAELGRFVGRDPLGTALDVNWMNHLSFLRAGAQYHDGMSLYRGYFTVNGVDPSGMRMDEDGSGGGRSDTGNGGTTEEPPEGDGCPWGTDENGNPIIIQPNQFAYGDDTEVDCTNSDGCPDTKTVNIKYKCVCNSIGSCGLQVTEDSPVTIRACGSTSFG